MLGSVGVNFFFFFFFFWKAINIAGHKNRVGRISGNIDIFRPKDASFRKETSLTLQRDSSPRPRYPMSGALSSHSRSRQNR